MTALKPIENRRVHGVQNGPPKYPLNETCAHPECSEPTADPHHCFPRSAIGNAYWYVEIHQGILMGGDGEDYIIPHVAGLCRAHHDDVEEHRAWIKLEDGEFVWYDEITRAEVEAMGEVYEQYGQSHSLWREVGMLNPQPGSREGKPKRRKFRGEKRRARKTLSFRVPDDAQENMAGIIDEGLETLEELLGFDPPRPLGYTLADAINFALMWARDLEEPSGQ